MSETTPHPALQFDTIQLAGDAPRVSGRACTVCGQPVTGSYYTVGDAVTCAGCRAALEHAYANPPGTRAGRATKAALFGLGGAVAGAVLYFAVAAITGYEIGLIAIAVGWLVGRAVHRGSGGRGGRRYQVMAVALTWFAVGAAYLSQGVAESVKSKQEAGAADSIRATGGEAGAVAPTSMTTAVPATGAAAIAPTPSAVGVASTAAADSARADDADGALGALGSVATLIGFALALPAIVGFSEFPSGVIGLLIVAFGLRQAWRMNERVERVYHGPFQLGDARPEGASAPAAGGA